MLIRSAAHIDPAASMGAAAPVNPAAAVEPAPINTPASKDALFIEQVRLLYGNRSIISISLVVAGVSAAAIWDLFPAWTIGAWLALYFLVVLGRLLLCDTYVRSANRDTMAHQWGWLFIAGTGITGILWGAFGGFVVLSPDPVYHLFAAFVLGGVVAGSMIGNTTYLPAFYGFMVPAALPAIAIMLTQADPIRIEMGVLLALFITVIAIVGDNLNRSILSEIRLRIEQGDLLANHGMLFDRLSKSEALMEQAQAIAHVGHWDFDRTSNSFTASKETFAIFGVDPAIFHPSLENVLARVHPDDKAMADDDFQRALTNHTAFGTEHRIVLDDGAIRFVQVAGKVSYDAERKTLHCVGTVQDVTRRHDFETKQQFANSLQSAELEASPDGLMVIDANDKIISYNQRFATMWGVPPPGLATGDHAPVLAAVMGAMREPEKFLARVRYFYAHPLEAGHDELETLSGQFIERYTAGLRSETGESLGRVWFFRDITARRTAETSVLHTARFDALTGLANRAVTVEALQRAITDGKRDGKTFALFYLDLDHFKDVNDTLGHPVGDALLRAVAGRLRSNTRTEDTVARFGGDEFAIVVLDIHEPTDAGVLAEKLLNELGEPYLIEGNIIQTAASIGIDFHGPEAADAETLLSHADLALYRAKSEGRGSYRFFTGAMDAEVRARVIMGADLRKALAEDQFFLVYQPQVSLDTGRIVGVEALVRWQHPERGVVRPEAFIHQAERFGLIRELDHWVLWTACRQAKAWLVAGIAPIRMSVNLSALEFKTVDALETDINAALAETGLPPGQLELELTETVLMDATRNHNDFFQRLRQRGITIAIDDFGTGYSSLGYLSQYPSDRIKIAQEFVKGLPSSSESAAIVKATLGLGRDLGMMVIAEGVETAEQLDLLTSWGCREVQGYYFSKPVDAADLLPLLTAGVMIVARDAAAPPRLEAAVSKRPQDLDQRLEAYATWIAELRRGKSAAPPPTDAADPLAKLGTELKLLSAGISQRESELIRLFQIVHTVERGILVDDVLNGVFEGFVGIIPYDRIGCAFLSDGGTRLTAYWARSNLGPLQIAKGYSQPLASSSIQEVFRNGQPRILNDLEAYLAANPGSDSTARIVAEGGRSSLTCPLFVDGRPLGMLFFTSRKKNAYGDLHQAVFRQIAEEVAMVINKSRLFQELVDSNKFLLRQAEQLKEVANRDALTGVLNRGAFMVTLDRQILANAAVGKSLGVIMIDIDHFKAVNDTYGHAAGDLVLREFTHRLFSLLRQSDYLGRYGGDEFLLLIGETHADDLPKVAERFRLAIADSPFDIGTAKRPITASVGLAVVSNAVKRAEAVVAVADAALYAAKTGGRNRMVLA